MPKPKGKFRFSPIEYNFVFVVCVSIFKIHQERLCEIGRRIGVMTERLRGEIRFEQKNDNAFLAKRRQDEEEERRHTVA
jgi:hypothetical protein